MTFSTPFIILYMLCNIIYFYYCYYCYCYYCYCYYCYY